MDIRQLEIFLAVVDTSSVTIAAGQMNLSPGAVSLQLQNLATGLHTELFVRAAKQRRRSAALSGPIVPGQLGTLLAFTAGLQGTNVTDSNRQRRYAGSFGALHPAHILIGIASHSRGAYLPLSMLLEYCKLRGGRPGFCDRKPRLVRSAGMQS